MPSIPKKHKEGDDCRVTELTGDCLFSLLSSHMGYTVEEEEWRNGEMPQKARAHAKGLTPAS